jgi:hypothetical protein
MKNSNPHHDISHIKFNAYDLQNIINGLIVSKDIPDVEKIGPLYAFAGSAAYFIRVLVKASDGTEQDIQTAEQLATDLETVGAAIWEGKVKIEDFARMLLSDQDDSAS